MKLIQITTLTLLSLSLSACFNNGPSDSDIESAMEKSMNEFKTKISGGSIPPGMADKMKFEIHSMTNYGCTESKTEASIYECDIELDMTVPMIGKQKNRSITKFTKKDGEWIGVK